MNQDQARRWAEEVLADEELNNIAFSFSLQAFDNPEGRRKFAKEVIAAHGIKEQA